MTADLVAFLHARLADDERVALAAEEAPWDIDETDDEVRSAQPHRGTVAIIVRDEDRRHIARWDPARVLADVQAKRQILEHEDMWGEDSTILLILAQPFSDHPDFDEAWRVDVSAAAVREHLD